MSTQINPTVINRTAKPVVAGIFNIVIGSFSILGALMIGIGALLFLPAGGNMFGGLPFNSEIIALLVPVPLIALGVLSIFGGICELQRRMWGWALAGSIAAACVSTAFGIASIVLTSISKREFA
jgi:hypothetical protein